MLNCLSTVWVIILWSVVRHFGLGREEIDWISVGADRTDSGAVWTSLEAVWIDSRTRGIRLDRLGDRVNQRGSRCCPAVAVGTRPPPQSRRCYWELRRCELLGHCSPSGKPPTVGWTDAAATSPLFSLLSFRRAFVAENFSLLPSPRETVDHLAVPGSVSCFRIVLYTL